MSEKDQAILIPFSNIQKYLRYFNSKISNNKLLLLNGLLLISNTFINSFFGFAFWIIGARLFTKSLVGLGAAYISALTLLTMLGELGQGTALIQFAPRAGVLKSKLLNSLFSVMVTSTVFIVIIFIIGAPVWSSELKELSNSIPFDLLFIFSTLFFASGQLIDRVFIAFQISQYMLFRNLIANIVRVCLMLLIGQAFGAAGFLISVGMSALFSLFTAYTYFIKKAVPKFHLQPVFDKTLIKKTISYSLVNHISILLWSAPPLLYPLIIVNLLGSEANAQFYITWMIANILFILPSAISTSVFANASNNIGGEKIIWKAMGGCLLGVVPGIIPFVILSPYILNIFGHSYATEGGNLMFWLLLSAIPYTVNTFIIVYYRVIKRLLAVFILSSVIALLSLLLIVVFGKSYGLNGIGWGWAAAQFLGAVFSLVWVWISKALNKSLQKNNASTLIISPPENPNN